METELASIKMSSDGTILESKNVKEVQQVYNYSPNPKWHLRLLHSLKLKDTRIKEKAIGQYKIVFKEPLK